MRGTLNRLRFSVKIPGKETMRFGSFNPKNDDGRTIIFYNGEYYLASDEGDDEFPQILPMLLGPDTMVANGYYDQEHGEWLPVAKYFHENLCQQV